MKRGEYVPDELTNALAADRVARRDAQGGIFLDGYPRTPAQVDCLDRTLADAGQQLDYVVCLEGARDELVTRLTSRVAASGRSGDDPGLAELRLDVFDVETVPY